MLGHLTSALNHILVLDMKASIYLLDPCYIIYRTCDLEASIKVLYYNIKGCVSLDPSKISKSGWLGLQLDTWQWCNKLWYGLINSKFHINKKILFYITQHQTLSHVQCLKSPSWPLRDELDLWPQLIYTLSWESQHGEIKSRNLQRIIVIFFTHSQQNETNIVSSVLIPNDCHCSSKQL